MHGPGPRWGRRLVFGALLATGSIAFSGCLSSGYAYVSHRNPDGTELFFKVPTEWHIFTDDQITLANNPNITRTQISQIEGSKWIEAFMLNSHAKPSEALSYGDSYPSGFAGAIQLDPTTRQAFSLTSLRTIVLNTDPLATGSPDIPLAYSEFTGPDGLRGSRMTADVPVGGGKYATYEQIAEVDQATNYVFLIGVGCTATCWRPNEGIVNQILDSWSVKAVGKGD